MKLYNGLSPNGARVSIFLAEKGLELETQTLEIMRGDTRSPSFLVLNSLGQVPVLQLENGTVISESVAICRYLESKTAAPALFGSDAEAQARIEMWNRRIELNLFNVIGDVGRHELPYFKDFVEQNRDYAASQRRAFTSRLQWLDRELEDGRGFLAGDTFSVADITGMAMMLLCQFTDTQIPADLANLSGWADAMKQRPSFPILPS